MTRKCAACHRRALAGDKYCIHHSQAFHSLKEHYKAWVEAYGGISWDDFMGRLAKMDETGIYIKEVIELERKR
ncbi:MAG: hypothetical protein MN733_25930 [Nitrososphaera sp.]|nr:hypothetical protein [Nitrososphaera sp.]